MNLKLKQVLIIMCCLAPCLTSSAQTIELPKTAKKYTLKFENPIFQLPDSIKTKPIISLPSFSIDKLPIFCKFEERATQSSKINLRVRLGSLDYVDKLEGKTNY